ncbi:MAG: amidohydrolase family protein [Eubacteriales bacterium]
MGKTYGALYELIEGRQIINTHSHHLTDDKFTGLTLYDVLNMSYISWISPVFENNETGRRTFFERMSCNTYFIWLAKSLGILYGNGEALNNANWSLIDDNLRSAHADKDHHMKILTGKCNYKTIILDKYDNPGSDNGYPDINRPAYRCDMFLHADNAEGKDQNNNNPFEAIGYKPDSLKEYIKCVREVVISKKSKGCAALKIAIAYERGLDFENSNYEKAEKAYLHPDSSENEIKDLQDYIMFRLCDIAGELKMPLQIHTGLGNLKKTNAMQLRELVGFNPDTKFVLFHCSYPWFDDVLALTHNYRNVYPDLCWVPLISTSACERFLSEALEVGDSTRFCWGCDTWTSEESFGAMLAVRQVIAGTLARKIDNGMMDMEYAAMLAKRILFDNAKELYLL